MSSKTRLDQLRSLRRQLGSLLDQELVTGGMEAAAGDTPGAWAPSADVLETAAAFEVTAELPGVRREDIELRIVDGVLELRGQRRPRAEGGVFHRMEGRYGAFHRNLALSRDVDDGRIEAQLRDGVLLVRVGKKKPGVQRTEVAVDWSEDDG